MPKLGPPSMMLGKLCLPCAFYLVMPDKLRLVVMWACLLSRLNMAVQAQEYVIEAGDAEMNKVVSPKYKSIAVIALATPPKYVHRTHFYDDSNGYKNVRKNCSNATYILSKVLNETIYNKHKLPNPDGVEVRVEFWVQEITSVSEINSEFEMDIYINELWVDMGLKYSDMNPCKLNITLNQQVLEKLWMPNSCFVNSKLAKIHNSPFKNVFLMIYPNGTVWVNYRVKVIGPCYMDLRKFPMDVQTCSLIYESFNYNLEQVKMKWEDNIEKPVWTLKNITLPDYYLINIIANQHKAIYPAGRWIELTVTFTFQRRYVWYFLQAYIPTYLAIFLSWVSFTLGSDAIPARTMLCVNALLAMMFQFGTVMRNIPRVSYVKAIDVWKLACMTFIFGALLELAMIGYLEKQSTPRRKKCPHAHNQSFTTTQPNKARTRLNSDGPFSPVPYRGLSNAKDTAHMDLMPPLIETRVPRPLASTVSLGPRGSTASSCAQSVCQCICHRIGVRWTAKRIDSVSSILFPAAFSIFNITYWTYYLY